MFKCVIAMRVYISSTPEELEPHRTAACEVASELGWEPVVRNPSAGRGLDPVTACQRQVASADFVVAIVGWRRGRVPTPELGGDGLRFWTCGRMPELSQRPRLAPEALASRGIAGGLGSDVLDGDEAPAALVDRAHTTAAEQALEAVGADGLVQGLVILWLVLYSRR